MRKIRLFILLPAFFGMIVSSGLRAAEIDLDVSLSQIYSDNIQLQPDETARDDFVTRISPHIGIDSAGDAAELSFDYTYEYLFYWDDSSFNQDFHQLDTNALVDLVGDQLQVYGVAKYTQVNTDPERPLESSNVTLGGNRSNAGFWQIGPRWQRQLFFDSEIEAYYDFGRVNYEDPESQDVDSQKTGVRISTVEDSAATTTYELNYEYWSLDYQTTGDVRNQELWFQFFQEIFYGFRLTGLVGLDSDLADPKHSSLSEGRWEFGIELSGRNGEVTASIGKRYFGTIFRLGASRSFSDWTITAAYSEEPGTTESQIFKGEIGKTSAEDELEPPDSGIDRYGNEARWIRKRADGSIVWEGYKSSFVLQLWWDKREDLPFIDQGIIDSGSDDFFSIGGEESIGSTANYQWRLGTHTTTGLSATLTRRDFTNLLFQGDGITETFSTVDSFSILGNIGYALGVNTLLDAIASYRKDSGTTVLNNFSEFRVQLDLTRKF